MQRLSRVIALGYIALCLAVLGASFALGPLGYAPFPLVAAPARAPVVLTIWYGSEKQQWLEAARERFLAGAPTLNGRPIQVQLKSMGARELAERLKNQDWRGDAPPAAVAPASSLWLDALNAPIVRAGAGAPRPLALSPLVLVAWQQRAQALWPQPPRDFWGELRAALASPGGWKALGGSESWGLVKLGHASPASSNGGAQTLTLMAYSFFGKNDGLSAADASDPALADWLGPIEAGVPGFAESTAALMSDMVRAGPAKYDFALVYENLALQNMDAALGRQGQALRIFYPPATILSDHPYALADGAWVQPDQRAAAERFRDFLLGAEAQQLARRYGLRPIDPGVPIAAAGADNPFTKYAANGVQVAIAGQVQPPPAEALLALVQLWQQKFRH